MVLKRVSCVLVLVAVVIFCSANAIAGGLALNELRISDSTNDDDNNFFEIAGNPGDSLDGLTVLTLSGEFEPGQIDFATPCRSFHPG